MEDKFAISTKHGHSAAEKLGVLYDNTDTNDDTDNEEQPRLQGEDQHNLKQLETGSESTDNLLQSLDQKKGEGCYRDQQNRNCIDNLNSDHPSKSQLPLSRDILIDPVSRNGNISQQSSIDSCDQSWTGPKSKFYEASKMLRRRIPQSGHLMTAKRFWLQTAPSNDCDIVLTFPPDTSEVTVAWLRARLQRVSDLSVITRTVSLSRSRARLSSCFAFQITANYNTFLRGLEELHIPKPLREDLGGGHKEFIFSELSNYYQVEDPEKFLTSAERQAVLHHILYSLKAEAGDCVEGLKLREGEAVVPKCLSSGVVSQLYPLHDLTSLASLQTSWVKNIFALQPLDVISSYFGIKISFYFAWLGHYTTALTVPAIVGAVFWFFFCGRAEFLSDLGFVLFSFFNVLWATLYLASWKRRSAELAYKWGTLDKRDELLIEPRPLYQGEEKISDVTGKPEPYFPNWKRNIFRYFVTIPVILFSLLTVFLCVFLILELQEWLDGIIEEKGLISFIRYFPKILLAIIIPVLDSAYNQVAVWLNDNENYKTEERFENQLIIKKTLFQFVNSFWALFYTAFYLQDVDKLKELLAALLITRQVIGNLKESLLPYAKKQLKLAKMSFDMFGALSPTEEQPSQEAAGLANQPVEELAPGNYKKTDGDWPQGEVAGAGDLKKRGSRVVSQVEVEGSTPQYEGTFDDYLEMFIQFGYVTLFSSAYPLAGLCALLNNLIEIRSDAFKLCFIHQRPFPQRVSNIGSWHTAMEAMGIIGVVVNCGLIGLLGPVHRIFPNITPVQTVILIILLEHLMLLVKLLVTAAIPDIPHWVAQEMAKIEYRRREVERRSGSSHRFPSFDSMDTEDKATQIDNNTEEIIVNTQNTSLDCEELMETGWERMEGNSLTEQEVFLATVSNMKPEEVFARGLGREARSRLDSGTFSPVNEDAGSHHESQIPEKENVVEVGHHMFEPGQGGIRTRSLSTRVRESSPLELFRESFKSHGEARRQSSESDLLSGQREGYIFINEMPPTPELSVDSAVGAKSGPTPPQKRVLEQKEFDKKLKAKRAIFSRGRSISLASFKLPSRIKFDKDKSPKAGSSKRKYSDEPCSNLNVVRGEMDLFNIEQLINIKDLESPVLGHGTA